MTQDTRYTVYLHNGVGIYGKDSDNIPWCSWGGPTEICSDCGKHIDSGYVRNGYVFKNEVRGEWVDATYHCCEHVHLAHDPNTHYNLGGLRDSIVGDLEKLNESYVEGYGVESIGVIEVAIQVQELFDSNVPYSELQAKMIQLLRDCEGRETEGLETQTYDEITDILRYYVGRFLSN